ncbi:GNAT family N-acetyltransferase [Saccharothrix violaceirubra]|uniref:Putative acetyltransferase n=1 Tax=Saccharothrix violaceirubra TaxID=413306 RepID=A0A7W7T8R2_9PSEU|nr:GNAT family N-acetyltransferase [Saccharothrix violaceirubra]MBB4968624.1 putative acetyltransferase [Saccharothrix violaceirubra]
MPIRTLTDDDAEPVDRLRKVAFGRATGRNPLQPGVRGLLTEIDGHAVGVLTIKDFHQFHGGTPVPMGGVGLVAVDPHARGTGVASAMLDHALRDMRDHGQVLSALFATVPGLYRSRGWERAGVLEWIELGLDRLPRSGPRVRSRALSEADLPALHACYVDLASTVNGLLDRRPPTFDPRHLLDADVVSVVPGHDGEVRGYLVAERDRTELRVHDLVGRDATTLQGLIAELGSWSGVLDKISVRVTDPAVTGLLTGQGIKYTSTVSPWLLRVVDLPAAVALRGWPVARHLANAAVDLDVVDEHAPWHAGRHRLVVEDGQVRVEPGGTGEVRVHARALGAWYSGMQDTNALRRAGLLDGPAGLLDLLVGVPGVPRLADFF